MAGTTGLEPAASAVTGPNPLRVLPRLLGLCQALSGFLRDDGALWDTFLGHAAGYSVSHVLNLLMNL